MSTSHHAQTAGHRHRDHTSHGKLVVPDDPIIPFIEGDGTGPDIWRASVRVLDAAVAKAYGGKRQIAWMEVYAGEKSFKQFNNWLPDETVEAFRTYLVGIKGPLTTPVGGGIRSLNVALRQMLDLFVCLRPVRWYKGVPSPVQASGKSRHGDLPREHRRHLRGHRVRGRIAGSAEGPRFLRQGIPEGVQEDPLRHRRGVAAAGSSSSKASARRSARWACEVGVGLKPISYLGTERLVHSAISYAIAEQAQERDAGAQGQHHEVHRRRVPRLGLRVAKSFFGAEEIDGGPWCRIPDGKPGAGLVIKDAIADITLQQVLTRPDEFDVIATPNLNGDYLSDALAAQVGGIGIAPGGNINYITGHAVFEATHGTAPKYANQDKVNPGSVILSGEMMLRHMGWPEAADLVVKGMDGAIAAKKVTYDFARLMDGATELQTSEFADAIIYATCGRIEAMNRKVTSWAAPATSARRSPGASPTRTWPMS